MAFATNRSVNWVTGIPVNVKHIYKSVEKHEISNDHKLAVDAYLVACSSKSYDLYFNDKKKKDIETRQVFERIISVILVFAKQDLPFRGHRNEICYSFQDSSSKIGNFFGNCKVGGKI